MEKANFIIKAVVQISEYHQDSVPKNKLVNENRAQISHYAIFLATLFLKGKSSGKMNQANIIGFWTWFSSFPCEEILLMLDISLILFMHFIFI